MRRAKEDILGEKRGAVQSAAGISAERRPASFFRWRKHRNDSRPLLAGSPDASFVYLSGAGANRTSRMMWARVKAEAEDRLAELKLARHANVRPAAILPMQPTGATRWLLAPLLKVIPALGIGSVDLGRAMLGIGLDKSWQGSRTLENNDLK